MTILCRSCKTAKIAFKMKVIAKVSEYSLNLKTIKFKVLNCLNLTLFFLRLWQLLSELMYIEQKVHHSFGYSIFEEVRIIYLIRMTSLQKKSLIFPISVNFSLGFVFLVDKHRHLSYCNVLFISHM